jgi:hypothetical protein
MGWRYGVSILVVSIALAIAPGRSADARPKSMTGELERDEPTLLWSGRVAAPTPSPSRIVVEGSEMDGRFVPHAVRVPDDGPAQAMKVPFPIGENLLDRVQTRLFGSEERVEAERPQDGLVIRCGAGTAPAGVVLETGSFHFPRAAHLRLVLAGLGSGEQLGLSLVERGSDAPSPPQAIMDAEGGMLQIPPSRPADVSPSREIVISCPPGPASLWLNSVGLEPGLPPSPISNTGTWLWNPEEWLARPRQIEEWALASQLERVFIQLKIDNGEVADQNALADFVTQLGKHGIAAHAVEGDPAMATAEGLSHALRRVAAIRRYQLSSQPDAALDGLQFDIEPYLLADFALDPAGIWARWAGAIQALSSTWGEPVSVVVPFWMLDSEAGAAAATAVRPVMSNLTVMAYRTEVGQVTALSEPWLAWGTLNDVPVSVAIENGPLGAEVHRTFVRAETGSLLLAIEGRTATVSLFSNPAEARQDDLAYAFHHETRINPARISFMNNRDKLAVARAELTRLLVAWPSFDGLMIHALDKTDRGVGGPRILVPEARANEPQAPDPDL